MNANRRGTNHFAGGRVLLRRGETALQMQWARTSVVVETIGGVGLLLRFHDDGAGTQSMHRTAGDVNHFSLIDVDPVEQLFGAILMDGLLELRGRHAGLQAESDLRSRFSVGYVPTFGFPPGLAKTLRSGVVGVHLDGKLLFGK